MSIIDDALEFIYARAKDAANPQPTVRKIGKRQLAVTLDGVTTIEQIPRDLAVREAYDID